MGRSPVTGSPVFSRREAVGYLNAVAYSEAGRRADAVNLLRTALADCERHLGLGHPMTGTIRDHLRAASR